MSWYFFNWISFSFWIVCDPDTNGQWFTESCVVRDHVAPVQTSLHPRSQVAWGKMLSPAKVFTRTVPHSKL